MNRAQQTKSKKSKSSKKAQGGVNLRQATSSLSIPSTSRNQSRAQQSQAPNSIAVSQRQRGPKSSTSFDGRMIVIQRRELIASVAGSVAFAVKKYAVNPGVKETFPLLSIQAPQWEQYRFRRLRFEYITRCSTTTVGSVIMAPDFDAEDNSPASEAQISGYSGAVEDAPWKNISCDIDCNLITPGPRKFIRSAAIAGDIKNYDALNFFLATVEEADGSSIGKLWVDYEVELHVPQNSPSDLAPKRVSMFVHSGSTALTTTVNQAQPFDTIVADPLGVGLPVLGVFTPPAGNYKITAQCGLEDTSAEVMTNVLSFFKNGAALTPVQTIRFSETMAANQIVQASLFGLVTVNGTDTIQFVLNATGAAGALSSPANYPKILWELA